MILYRGGLLKKEAVGLFQAREGADGGDDGLEGMEVGIVLKSQIGARYGAPLRSRLVKGFKSVK